MSSLLMAICINGMTDEETFALTKIFSNTADTFALLLFNLNVCKNSKVSLSITWETAEAKLLNIVWVSKLVASWSIVIPLLLNSLAKKE